MMNQLEIRTENDADANDNALLILNLQSIDIAIIFPFEKIQSRRRATGQ